uniref:Uncharacterized protein n=1 Tax=Anguilla anguilla TaxID=7936 RepID=A0A0E9RPK6_ANGAN
MLSIIPHCSKMILIVIAKSSRLTEFYQSLLSYRSVWSHGCRVCLFTEHASSPHYPTIS